MHGLPSQCPTGEVIDHVHDLARRNPAGGAIGFGWRNGVEIDDGLNNGDDFHNEDYTPDSESSGEDSHVSADNYDDNGTNTESEHGDDNANPIFIAGVDGDDNTDGAASVVRINAD